MNSLVDWPIIQELYEASQAGVRDRPHRARHLLPAARRAGPVRATSASSRSSTASSSTPDLLLPERRRAGVLPRLRGLDAAQSRPSRRDRLPGARPEDPGDPSGNPRDPARGYCEGAAHSARRHVGARPGGRSARSALSRAALRPDRRGRNARSLAGAGKGRSASATTSGSRRIYRGVIVL